MFIASSPISGIAGIAGIGGISGIEGSAAIGVILGIAGIAGTGGIADVGGKAGIAGIWTADCGLPGAAASINPHPARIAVKVTNRVGRIGAPPFSLFIDVRRHPSVWSGSQIFVRSVRSGKSARINGKR